MQPLNRYSFDAAEFSLHLPPEGRLLAVDHGSKRIGLAISDVSRRFVNPLEVVPYTKHAATLETLVSRIREHQVVGIIMGYPLNMDGSAGPRCQSVRQFSRSLFEALEPRLPLLLWDERLSSDIAHNQMRDAGLKAAWRGDKIDKLAAAAILESFVERVSSP